MVTKKKTEEPILFYMEHEICSQIKDAYPLPAYTVLSFLRDGTGFQTRGQEADAMAFGTWPSRGLKVIGFEIKSYRSDWLRELKNPQKAETFACYCDEWWIVGTEDVVKLEEVPDVWGWAKPTPKGLRTVKLPKAIESIEINKIFLMSIMRNIGNSYTPNKEVDSKIEKRVKEEVEKLRDSAVTRLKYAEDNCETLSKKISDFEKASGFDISTWRFNAQQVGALVKEITDGNIMSHLRNIESAGTGIQKVLEQIRALPFFKKEEAE